MIIRVPITEAMRREMRATASTKVLNRRTLVNTEGLLAGRAGEIVIQTYFPLLAHSSEAQDRSGFDFIAPSGVRIDVKAKGNVKSVPREDFDCTVPEYQTRLDCDAYIFVRIAHDFTCAYIMGYIRKAEFLKAARIVRDGERYNNAGRPAVGNHFIVPASVLTTLDPAQDYGTVLA